MKYINLPFPLLSAFILSFYFFCLPITNAQSGWVERQSKTQNTLLGIDYYPTDPSDLVAVGSNYVIRRSTDAGTTWHEGFDPKYIFDVAFIDTGSTAVAIAVGAQGRILRTANGGQSWSTRTSPTNRRLHDVNFPTPTIGYAVGELGTVIKTTDAGLTWFIPGVVSPFNLNGVSFVSADTGIVVGTNGSIFLTNTGGAAWIAQNSGTPQTLNSVDHWPNDPQEITAVGDSGVILRTTNGGTTWVGGGTPDPTDLNKVTFFDSNRGVIVGAEGKIFLTSNGGNTWIPQTTGVGTSLHGVAYYPADPNEITAVGGDGIILRTTNGGSTWLQQTSYTVNVLRGIAMTRTTRIAAGAGDVVRRSTNNGTSWLTVSNGYILRDVCTVPGTQEAWAVGDGATTLSSIFFYSSDGGINWEMRFNYGVESFSAVQFLDSQRGYLGSSSLGRVYRTTDGGQSWINTSTPPPMVRVFDLVFNDSITGHAVGASGLDGRISYTTDGGTNWIGQTPGSIPFLRGIDFYPSDPDVRIVVGDSGRIYGTTNFGQTWIQRISGTTQDLKRLAYGSASNVYAVGNAGTIIGSSDGGTTWSSQSSGTTTTLNDVAFISSDTGFVVGNTGLILMTTTGGVVSVEDPSPITSIPARFSLEQNYPNPFNPSTKISWQSPVGSWQTLKVFDVLGNEIATLVNEEKAAGTYEITWYAENLPSGVYFYQMLVSALQSKDGKAGNYIETKKMILMK